MAIGNIIGSQIFNILLIIGTTATVNPIFYSIKYNWDMCFLLTGTIIFAIFPYVGKKHFMTRTNGLIFVILYLLYLVYNFIA